MENQDSFTEVSTESWGSRIIGSIKSVLFGIALFLAAFILLWWNEGRAVKTAKGLTEGASLVVKADVNTLDKANSGKLIHITGKVITDDILKDDEFDLQVNALKLRRNVEMYQWVQSTDTKSEKQIGGSEKTTTTYNYEKQWSNHLSKSKDFKIIEGHVNPLAFPYSKYTQQVNHSSVGAYSLSSSLLSQISNYTSYSVSKIDTVKFKNAKILNEGNANVIDGVSITQKIFIGKGTSMSPVVGDVKVSFDVVNSGSDYSILAKQVGNTFEHYNTSVGTSIEMISLGVISSENMFEEAQKNNAITTWILRFVGFLMMFFGLSLIFNPLVVLADVLPMLGSLLDVGISLFSGVISFSLSFITIAIAWIFYRPILGICLLAIGIAAVVFFFMKASKKRKLATASS